MSAGRGPCAGCGHAERNHLHGGLCLVKSCVLCLIYRPRPAATDEGNTWLWCTSTGGNSLGTDTVWARWLDAIGEDRHDDGQAVYGPGLILHPERAHEIIARQARLGRHGWYP